MRRLISFVFAGAMVATLAGTTLAAPKGTATMWACLYSVNGETGVQTTTDWSGYHPDTLVNVAWVDGTSTVFTYSPSRSVQWKFGTSQYDTSYSNWATSAPTLAWPSDTMLAVQLYSKGRLLAQTPAVSYGGLVPC